MTLRFDPIAEARRNWQAHNWAAIETMSAATSITRAHQILLAEINAALEPHRLTFSRYEALALLHFSREGLLPLGKIGERLQVHPTSVTNTIDRLEADGLVERQPHPTDGRTTLAVLTEAGRERLLAATQALTDVQFGLGALSTGELANIDNAIHSLRQAAGDFEDPTDQP